MYFLKNSEDEVMQCVWQVEHLSSLVQWPTGAEASQAVAQFQAMAGFPGVLGALFLLYALSD